MFAYIDETGADLFEKSPPHSNGSDMVRSDRETLKMGMAESVKKKGRDVLPRPHLIISGWYVQVHA